MEKDYKSQLSPIDIVKMIKISAEEGRKKGMIQGMALAIASIYKGYGPREIWESAGLSIQECYANGVDDYNMEELLKHEELGD